MDKKIMLVDDAAFMRMMIKDALTKNGYTNIIEAADGEIACTKYAAELSAFKGTDLPSMSFIAFSGVIISLKNLGSFHKVKPQPFLPLSQ